MVRPIRLALKVPATADMRVAEVRSGRLKLVLAAGTHEVRCGSKPAELEAAKSSPLSSYKKKFEALKLV